MKKMISHRGSGKPYPVKKSYNHAGDKSSKGVGAHATHGGKSKAKK